MRNQAKADVINQQKVVASKTADVIVYDDKWSTPLRDQKEQELEEARELLKVYQDRYQELASKVLTGLYIRRKTLCVRIDSLASYDLDLEEELMATDRFIGCIEKEAEELAITLNTEIR